MFSPLLLHARYGRLDHEDWCTHKAGLCTWNLNRSGVSGNKPDSVIDTASCLMSVDFHPVKPALIAGGTFNGEFELSLVCCCLHQTLLRELIHS